MKAMILCAGRSSRLGELTKITPKPLLPIQNEPVIIHILRWLRANNLTEVVINLHYLGSQIRSYLRGIPNIQYIGEKRLLGTSGGVKNARRFLGDTFVVTHGDTLTNFNILNMVNYHKDNNALATIALYPGNSNGAGLVEINQSNQLTGFHEKSIYDTPGLINAGVYVFEKGIFDYIPKGFSDFGYNVFPRIVNKKLPVYGYILEDECHLIDMGTLEGYEKAKEMYEK